MKMKRLKLIPQAIVLLLVFPGAVDAGACLPPLRPFVPNDPVALAEFADLIGKDFETYIEDVQAYFRCLEQERARAFDEARQVSQDYERFLLERDADNR
ncbi:hypothetical protein [Pseudophaeobacter sp. TrK17]|jgi:hypothetical protein|uniref:hypothetical protein n=1 Tax=Pseudophaeobacter sp. TrK17 TaxID=2815167 RepID=UPI0035D0DD5F